MDGCCTASKIRSQRRKGRGSELEHYHHILHPLVSNCCFVDFFFSSSFSSSLFIHFGFDSFLPFFPWFLLPVSPSFPLWTKVTRKDDWEETGAKKSNGSVDCLIVHWEKKSVCCLRSHQQQQQKPKDKSKKKKKKGKKKFFCLLAFFFFVVFFFWAFESFYSSKKKGVHFDSRKLAKTDWAAYASAVRMMS